MNRQQRILERVIFFNYVLFVFFTFISFLFTKVLFALGVVAGGSMTVVNFYFLKRILYNFFVKENNKNYFFVLMRYYVRFLLTGLLIICLIQYKIVDPIGLFLGLSIVVISVVITALIELKKLIFKEAV